MVRVLWPHPFICSPSDILEARPATFLQFLFFVNVPARPLMLVFKMAFVAATPAPQPPLAKPLRKGASE